ncbi:hypothetical protein LK07_15815 [Streptomyces pluripotens]|uniref:5'-nucleotidase n=1 Tax=Streptomyces pluripotens TaxID=1355015 RepID=A0A221NZ19_9ACTN|nr:hypothetical protein LK06_014685 [Streptomyces pluripotens]ASN25249.1 hypothetical protein LK07_15815 [Streptomyces pluripotens]
MRKRMLRSVLVAAFSAVVAFGTLNGLSTAKSDVRADTQWSFVKPGGAVDDYAAAAPSDTQWS